ncbi:MAG TPA: hypothetical protein VGW10_04160 [Solirubrobacteraceae bacterium]|nr:hypothetical protein [Solirubrobacteraceae bacterium]
MDTSRISRGEMIAGAGGIGLFLFLFVDWASTVSAWEAFDVVDIVLAAIGLGVVALVAARAAGQNVAVPGGSGTAIALAGFAAAIITLTFLLESDDREIGLYLSVLAALAIVYGGWVASRGPVAPRPATTAPPPPPPA